MSVRRRIMVVGAGRGQMGLYAAAHRMGLVTIAAGLDGDYPGLAVADEKCFVNITRPAEVVAAAKSLNIDAVVTSCMDTGVEALGAVNDALGFRGISQEVARSSFDKVLQKRALLDAGVPVADCVISKGEPRDLDEAEVRLGYPLVLKKRHSQSSNGVFVVNDRLQAESVLEREFRDEDEFLIEEYLQGDEFGAQACVVDGDIRFVMLHGDLLFQSHAPIPVGHFCPVNLTEDRAEIARDAAIKAIRASDFDNCAVNMDFKMSGNEVRVMELTGRAGANGLPELVGMNYGIDYYESIIRVALGLPVTSSDSDAPNATLAKMILPDRDGTLSAVSLKPIDPQVFEVQAFRSAGSHVNRYESANDCIGQVSVMGESVEFCEALADRQAASSFLIQ